MQQWTILFQFEDDGHKSRDCLIGYELYIATFWSYISLALSRLYVQETRLNLINHSLSLSLS